MKRIYLVARRADTWANQTKMLMEVPEGNYLGEGDILFKHGEKGTAEYRVIKDALISDKDALEMLVAVLGEPVMADGMMIVTEFAEHKEAENG